MRGNFGKELSFRPSQRSRKVTSSKYRSKVYAFFLYEESVISHKIFEKVLLESFQFQRFGAQLTLRKHFAFLAVTRVRIHGETYN